MTLRIVNFLGINQTSWLLQNFGFALPRPMERETLSSLDVKTKITLEIKNKEIACVFNDDKNLFDYQKIHEVTTFLARFGLTGIFFRSSELEGYPIKCVLFFIDNVVTQLISRKTTNQDKDKDKDKGKDKGKDKDKNKDKDLSLDPSMLINEEKFKDLSRVEHVIVISLEIKDVPVFNLKPHEQSENKSWYAPTAFFPWQVATKSNINPDSKKVNNVTQAAVRKYFLDWKFFSKSSDSFYEKDVMFSKVVNMPHARRRLNIPVDLKKVFLLHDKQETKNEKDKQNMTKTKTAMTAMSSMLYMQKCFLLKSIIEHAFLMEFFSKRTSGKLLLLKNPESTTLKSASKSISKPSGLNLSSAKAAKAPVSAYIEVYKKLIRLSFENIFEQKKVEFNEFSEEILDLLITEISSILDSKDRTPYEYTHFFDKILVHFVKHENQNLDLVNILSLISVFYLVSWQMQATLHGQNQSLANVLEHKFDCQFIHIPGFVPWEDESIPARFIQPFPLPQHKALMTSSLLFVKPNAEVTNIHIFLHILRQFPDSLNKHIVNMSWPNQSFYKIRYFVLQSLSKAPRVADVIHPSVGPLILFEFHQEIFKFIKGVDGRDDIKSKEWKKYTVNEFSDQEQYSVRLIIYEKLPIARQPDKLSTVAIEHTYRRQ